MNKVSIIMAVFNGAEHLVDTIESVLTQTYKDFEFIIVNDGSMDKSVNIVENYQTYDKRIILIHKHHTGLADSLNEGLKKACGKYIARIDADDLWFANKLELQLNYLNNNQDVSLLGSFVKFIDQNNVIIKSKNGFNKGLFMNHETIIKNILRRNLFCHSTVIFRREIIEDIGYYNDRLKISMDYEYWIRILNSYKGVILKERLVQYRISPKMLSVRKSTLQVWESINIRLFGYFFLRYPIKYVICLILDISGLLLKLVYFKFKKAIGYLIGIESV